MHLDLDPHTWKLIGDGVVIGCRRLVRSDPSANTGTFPSTYVKLEPPVIWRKPARNQELHPVGSDRGEYKPEYYLKCAWKGSKINQFESRNRESSCMADLHICDVQSRGVRFRVFDDLL
jgi:hypothetical protein